MAPQQVFLSYSHRDDEPYGPQQRRWVEEFEKALRESIGQRVGPGRVEVWRDKRRLTGNELFDEQIERQLDRSAILVTVLSQHYLSSAYCKKEFVAFGQRHLQKGDLHVDHLSRIVKVYRRAIERADLRRFVDEPALIPDVDRTVGFDLFYKDDNGIDRDVLLDPAKAGLYWQRADDIAFAIKRILDSDPEAQKGAAQTTAKPAVYLARTASDMKERRELLQRELEDRGYRVLPEQELPEDAEGYVAAVRNDLQRAALSVHLIGSRYGSTPDGSPKSGVVLQTELALAFDEPTLRSIFWAPPDLSTATLADERQRAFVEHLDQADFNRHRVEFVREPLEQLKALIVDRLTAGEQAIKKNAASTDAAGKAIYLVCDTIDRADTKPLQASLASLGFVVSRASIEGTVEELLEENKANLLNCDVVIIVWGGTREAWVRSKLREVQQAPGWGRTRSFAGRFVLIGPPDSAAKTDFDVPPGVTIVRGSESAAQLERLLQRGAAS